MPNHTKDTIEFSAHPYHMISNIIINKIYIFQSIRYKSNNHYDMYQCGIIIKNVKDNQSYDENEQWHEFI